MTERKPSTPINLNTESTRRPISPGAERELGEVKPVLDHGFVYLVDYMGNDEAIEQAARVSYGVGTRKASETRGLIRYLKRHWHTTPFEMIEFKFHSKMPIFVARQWVRHRTANINEYSARYSILDKEFYLPEPDVLAEQSGFNKQGRDKVVPPEYAEEVRQLLLADALNSYKNYEYMLNDDGENEPVDPTRPMIARELARMDLTLNYYTQWYWKIDLHNLFHFLMLRKDAHAQLEIRKYADAIGDVVKESVPLAWEAFVDYQLESTSLTRLDRQVLELILSANNINVGKKEILSLASRVGVTNKRERQEMLDKFRGFGIVND